jgi:hypothetical protein
MVSRWRQAFQQRGAEIFADPRDVQKRRQTQGCEPGEAPEDLKKLISELTGPHAVCFRPSDQSKPGGPCPEYCPKLDTVLAVWIEEAHEKDEMMGHRQVAAWLLSGKNRVTRVMRKSGLSSRDQTFCWHAGSWVLCPAPSHPRGSGHRPRLPQTGRTGDGRASNALV